MLLPRDSHPASSLYFNGAFIIKALKENDKELSLIDLYMETKRHRDMPIAIFVLALDWLFLADAICPNNNGSIKLCS